MIISTLDDLLTIAENCRTIIVDPPGGDKMEVLIKAVEHLTRIKRAANGDPEVKLFSVEMEARAIAATAGLISDPFSDDHVMTTVRDTIAKVRAETPAIMPPCTEPTLDDLRVAGALQIIDPPEYHGPPPSDADAPPGLDPAVNPESLSEDDTDKAYIHITTHEEQTVKAIIAALATDPCLWQREPGELVSIRRQASGPTNDAGEVLVPGGEGLTAKVGTPLIWRLPPPLVRERISSRCVLQKFNGREKEWQSAHVPDWVVPMVASRGTWPGIPLLRAVVEHPVLRPDGSVLSAPGYDPASCLYVSETAPEVTFPPAPTRDEAITAAASITEIVQDFPFRGPQAIAAWLCALLTPLARYAIDGPTPMFVVDANVRGSGKTLLVDTIGLALTGRPVPAQTYPKSEEEQEKILVSAAVAGLRLLNWDNVDIMVGSGCLDKWISSTCPTGRILGSSNQVPFEWSTVQFVTTNNCIVRADTDRRCLYVSLLSPLERPEHREDFHEKDLPGYIRKHRAAILSAAFTILAGHAAAGRPSCGGRQKGSFEAWTHIVRDAVLWVGLPDPERAAGDDTRPMDTDEATLDGLIDGIESLGGEHGVTTSQLVRAVEAYQKDRGSCPESLVMAVESACRGRKVTAVALGTAIHRLKERWHAGKYISAVKDVHSKIVVWKVVPKK